MACYLGRAAECDDPALRRVSGERAHTSVVDGRQGRSERTQRDRTWRELTGTLTRQSEIPSSSKSAAMNSAVVVTTLLTDDMQF